METSIRIHSSALTAELVDGIKAMFPDCMLHIVVRAVSGPDIVPEGAHIIPREGERMLDVADQGNDMAMYGNNVFRHGNGVAAQGNDTSKQLPNTSMLGNDVAEHGSSVATLGNNVLALGNNVSMLALEAALIHYLRSAEPGMYRSDTRQATARLLLHLAAHPTGNHGRLLAQHCGFTYSGTIKHMMQLRRRGLVERHGRQHYTLTPKAESYLAAAAQAAAGQG